MSDSEAMRETAREVLRELLPEVLGALRSAPANGNGHAPAVPLVPAPPVAAVLRPSTWTEPAAPGEVIGDVAAPAAVRDASPDGAEPVTLDTDADLQRFVTSLLHRFENPRERRALRTGQVRFTLRRGPGGTAAGAAPASPAIHIDKGAVTERIVREAAAAGARLVLARRAVLTPLARDQARALRVVVEREDR